MENRVIRKYNNRKLYDLSDSRYVTTADVLNMVVAGQQVKVVTNEGDQDVTRSVLFSALTEKSRKKEVDEQQLTNFLQKVAEYFNGGQNV